MDGHGEGALEGSGEVGDWRGEVKVTLEGRIGRETKAGRTQERRLEGEGARRLGVKKWTGGATRLNSQEMQEDKGAVIRGTLP